MSRYRLMLDRIRNTVEAEWTESLGDKHRPAFKAGRPFFQKEAAERIERAAPAGDNEQDEIIT